MTLLRTPRRIVDRFLNDPASIRNAAFLIIGATAVAVVAGALVMWLFDRAEYPTYGRAIWFTLQSVTTVGYGDVTPAHVVGRVVGGLVMLIAIGFIIYALIRHWLPGEPLRPRASHGVFWGALSGFTTTLIQIGAPPYYAFVLPQRLEKMIYVGTTVMFFAAANAMKIVPYFALGQFSTATLATSALLLPLAVATNFAGIWLVRMTPVEVFYRIAYWLVLVISLALTAQGAVALLRG